MAEQSKQWYEDKTMNTVYPRNDEKACLKDLKVSDKKMRMHNVFKSVIVWENRE